MPEEDAAADRPAPLGLERVGDYVLRRLVRRDRLGEVYDGVGPGPAGRATPVRVRMVPPAPSLVDTLDRLDRVDSAGVAPVIDRLADTDGRTAIVTLAPTTTLARRGRLGAEVLIALGPALLDGLAALHEARIAHGALRPENVGIDERGVPTLLDAGIAPALAGVRLPAAARLEADVVDCASMLRRAGPLPDAVAAIVEATASGEPDAITDARRLAATWRQAAADADLAVPPEGSAVAIAALEPGAGPRRPARGIQGARALTVALLLATFAMVALGSAGALSFRVATTLAALLGLGAVALLPLSIAGRWSDRWRRVTALAIAAAAVAMVPAAALGPPGQAAYASLGSYLPDLHRGAHLSYRLAARTGSAQTPSTQDVTLQVTDSGTVAGVRTVALQLQTQISKDETLPLGLMGGTIRDQGGALTRSIGGGAQVRDLAAPLGAGASWDNDAGVTSDLVQLRERRTVLGSARLDTAGRHLDRCAVVEITVDTSAAGSRGIAADGVAWYCPGVGLAHAEEAVETQRGQAGADRLTIDLTAIG